MQNMPIQQCQQYNPYVAPSDYSGVHIQIINPSVGVPGAAPVYNVNAPQYQTPSYPQNYYTNNWGTNPNTPQYTTQPQGTTVQQTITPSANGNTPTALQSGTTVQQTITPSANGNTPTAQQSGIQQTEQQGINPQASQQAKNPQNNQPLNTQQQVTVQPNGMNNQYPYQYQQQPNTVQQTVTNPYMANPYNNGFAEGYNAGYNNAINSQKICPCCNGTGHVNGMNANGVNANGNADANTSSTNINATSTTTETKKTEKRNIIELTDTYIKNLENYLNSQDKEVRLMGAKEVVARLQEDDSRRDDRALTALVNKMLQDPYQPVRFLALAMLDTRACTGDDYTVAVLQNIQQGKSGYGQDALQASQILLKMSGQTVQKEFEVKEEPKQKEKQ